MNTFNGHKHKVTQGSKFVGICVTKTPQRPDDDDDDDDNVLKVDLGDL